MIRITIYIVIALMMTGCKIEIGNNQSKVPDCTPDITRIPDIMTESGLMVWANSNPYNLNKAFFENNYTDVKQCLSMSAKKDVYIIIDDNYKKTTECFGNTEATAFTINIDNHPDIIVLDKDTSNDAILFKHESIHTIMHENGLLAQSSNHQPEYLWRCQWN